MNIVTVNQLFEVVVGNPNLCLEQNANNVTIGNISALKLSWSEIGSCRRKLCSLGLQEFGIMIGMWHRLRLSVTEVGKRPQVRELSETNKSRR